MGKNSSKLTAEELEYLEKTTYFTRREIKAWHKDFIRDCPGGKLNQNEFTNIYTQFFPNGNCTQFASLVFNVFDANRDGSISFSEFITALSITSRGTLDEKIEWAFSLYDLDGDGFITESEMAKIVEAIYGMVGHGEDTVSVDNDKDRHSACQSADKTRVAFKSSEQPLAAGDRVKAIFRRMDAVCWGARKTSNDSDGRITKEEFKAASKHDPWIVQAFTMA